MWGPTGLGREAGDKKAVAGPEEVQPSWLAPSPRLDTVPYTLAMWMLLSELLSEAGFQTCAWGCGKGHKED